MGSSPWYRVGLALPFLIVAEGMGSGCADVEPWHPKGLEGAVAIGASDPGTRRLLDTSEDGFDLWQNGFASRSVRTKGPKESIGFVVPTTADAPMTLGPGWVAPLRFELTPLGARHVEGELHEGRVVYAGAYEGVDAIAIAKPFVAEEFLLLSGPESVHDFSWNVRLPAEVAKVERRRDGLWFVDREGALVLRMPTPYVLTRTGTREDVDYTYRDSERVLELSVPRRQAAAYPLLLDPAFESRVWTELREPYNLTQPLLTYDTKRNETVLFSDNRTWILNGNAWTERVVGRGGASPGFRFGASLVYDQKREHTLLYGGTDPNGYPDAALWRWDGTAWKHLATNAGPEGSIRGAFAYDRAAERVVYFGGQTSLTSASMWDTTWMWDGTSWQAMTPATKPPPRVEHGMVYDVGRKRVVLFGGYGQSVLDDTWEWQNQTWTRVTSADANPKPAGRLSFAFAYDEARSRAVLFGGSSGGVPLGDTWTFDGSKWKRESPAVSPPGLVEATASYDAVTKRVLLMGGSGANGSNNNLWSWDGITWRVERVGNQPQVFGIRPILFEDTTRQELLHYAGGVDENSLSKDGYAWAHSGRIWSPRSFLPTPQRRVGADMVFDAARNKVVLFGGNDNVLMQETWTFANAAWTRVFPPTQPSARAHHRLAYHPPSNRVVLFGGVDEVGFPNDTWLWDGQTWSLAQTLNAPTGRTGHGLGFDPRSGKLLLVGGLAPDGQYLNDTWSWDSNGWVQLNPGGQPIETQGGSMLLCSPGDCYLLGLGGRRYRYAPPNWEELPGLSLPDLSGESSPKGVWDPRYEWFYVAARDTFVWKPSENQFSSEQVPFREGLVAWTGNDTMRFAEGPNGGAWLTFLRDDGGWHENASALSFPMNNGGGIYDAARGEGVLVGRSSAGDARLWTWDGVAMKARANLPLPSTGVGVALAYHPPSQTVLIVGDESERDSIRTWNGSTLSTWVPPGGSPVPTPRMYSAAAYDPKSGTVLLFGGDGDAGYLGDTWSWNGSTWQRLAPSQAPSARSHHAMTYDASLGAIVLLGGVDANGVCDDAWTWNGSTWVAFTTKVSPPRRYDAGFAHLSPAKRTILYGGFSDLPGDALTFPWALYGRGGACATDADCGASACVDGVCCESLSCGTCQTCAGSDPGVCTLIINDEDPDTCARKDRVSCNQKGVCGPALGGACQSGSDCGSGFCIEGVCCDSACDRPCESCRAETKQSAKDEGRCGPAAVGKNPGGRCAGSATCGAGGVCAENTSVSCRDGRYLVDFSGAETDCAPYRCAGKCLARCSSATDCVFPAVCDASGACIPPSSALSDDSGCSLRANRSTGSRDEGLFALLTAACAAALVRRRHTTPCDTSEDA